MSFEVFLGYVLRLLICFVYCIVNFSQLPTKTKLASCSCFKILIAIYTNGSYAEVT